VRSHDFAKSGGDAEANRRMLGLADRKGKFTMPIESSAHSHNRRLRLGMVGGGPGGFIGAVSIALLRDSMTAMSSLRPRDLKCGNEV